MTRIPWSAHGDVDVSSLQQTYTAAPTPTFADRLEQFGDAIAVATEDGELITYAELARRADEFAAALGPERRLLLIEAENDPTALIAYLGALRRRHPVLLAAGESSLLDRILATYEPDVRFRKKDGQWCIERHAQQPRELHPDLALLLSTSGSTGAAKLVRLSYDSIEANAKSIGEYLNIGADDRAITTLPIHYSYGLSVVSSHLFRGARLLLTDRSVTSAEFWRFFEAQQATSMAGVPYTYEMLERGSFRDKAVESLRTLTQAGGRLPPDLASKYAQWAGKRDVRFYVMYGQTEATARMAYVPPGQLLANPDCIGVAIPGGSFRLIDEENKEISAPDAVGELVYSGPNVMLGYASTSRDLAKGRELTELHTGDLAVKAPSGFFRIVGRKSRFIKLFGLRIGLDETEALLQAEGVRAIATGDDELLAVAILSEARPENVSALLVERLGIPSAAIDVASYTAAPTLASGKFDYQEILRRAKARVDTPASPETSSVLACFQHTFPGQAISPDDSFIGLGGDSLRYVRLSLEIEDRLGALPDRWEDMSIAQLEALGATALQKPRWWQLRKIESEIAIRAAAILAVVVNHASSLTVGGGAHVLLMLSGYNFSKYQKAHLTDGHAADTLTTFIRRVILPYYIILLSYFVFERKFDLPSLLLISNFFGRTASFLEPYWFLEALLQITAIFASLFMLPPVRRAAARDPWKFGLILLAGSILAKVIAFAIFGHHELQDRTPDAVFYMFAFGWCLHQANTASRRLLLTALAAGIVALQIGGPDWLWDQFAPPSNFTHALWFGLSVALILWAPRIPLTNWMHAPVALIAASSFYIYLTHGVPVHFIVYVLGWNSLAAALLASVLIGIATYLAVDHLSQSPRPGLARAV